MPYRYGIKNGYRPSQLAPKAYGWTRGQTYSSADVPSQWVDHQTDISAEGLRQQFAYEWFQSGEQFAGFTGERGLTNPPFVSGAAGRLHPLLMDAEGKQARILRGYIRRAEYDATDITSKARLYFMYNPTEITRDYVSYLNQDALDPFNTVYQSGNLIAPPSIMNFSFELFFDRQEESAAEADHPGVFVDYQFFDLVVRNVIPTDPNQSNNTLPDNGVMMVNPRDITVVFSPQITVQGRPINASVVFEKFTHRMTPVRMRIQLTILASYFGPVRDMVEYHKEELADEETIPFDEFRATVYDITFEEVERAADDANGLPGGVGSTNVDYNGQLGQSNDGNHKIRLQAMQWAIDNHIPGGPGVYGDMTSGWTNYATDNRANYQAERHDLPKSADCSGFVTAAYVATGQGTVMGWSGFPGTGSMANTVKSSNGVYVALSTLNWETDLLPGDILIRPAYQAKGGHCGFFVRYQTGGCIILDASSSTSSPEVGERPVSGIGSFTHLIRPTPLGSLGSAAQSSGYNGAVGTSYAGANTTAWSPGTKVASGPQPGMIKLRTKMSTLFSVANSGGYNPRCVKDHQMAVGTGPKCPYGDGMSQHACGLAYDAMTGDSKKHQDIIKWCLSAEGAQYGIHEVISGFSPIGKPARWADGQWKPLGAGQKQHKDHVHVSVTVAAGARA